MNSNIRIKGPYDPIWIRKILKSLDVDYKSFAKKIGKSRQTVFRWMNGTNIPDYFAMLDILSAYENLNPIDVVRDWTNARLSKKGKK